MIIILTLIIVVIFLSIFYTIFKKYKVMNFYSEQNIRGCDEQGCGYFNAPRLHSGNHQGVDFVTNPNEQIPVPFDCIVERVAKPYADDNRLSGIYCKGINEHKFDDFKIFYIKPNTKLIGKELKKGANIGTAQDITNKYKGITNHIHLQTYRNGTIINPLKII